MFLAVSWARYLLINKLYLYSLILSFLKNLLNFPLVSGTFWHWEFNGEHKGLVCPHGSNGDTYLLHNLSSISCLWCELAVLPPQHECQISQVSKGKSRRQGLCRRVILQVWPSGLPVGIKWELVRNAIIGTPPKTS